MVSFFDEYKWWRNWELISQLLEIPRHTVDKSTVRGLYQDKVRIFSCIYNGRHTKDDLISVLPSFEGGLEEDGEDGTGGGLWVCRESFTHYTQLSTTKEYKKTVRLTVDRPFMAQIEDVKKLNAVVDLRPLLGSGKYAAVASSVLEPLSSSGAIP